MIVPKTSSPTFLAALVRGSHLSLRSPCSSQRAGIGLQEDAEPCGDATGPSPGRRKFHNLSSCESRTRGIHLRPGWRPEASQRSQSDMKPLTSTRPTPKDANTRRTGQSEALS
jgi:hypothetical protein